MLSAFKKDNKHLIHKILTGILICFGFTALPGFLYAQTTPVEVSFQLIPPHSTYLQDYVSPELNKINLVLTVKDQEIDQLNVRLRFKIHSAGTGVTLRTKEEFRPVPIQLAGGTSEMITGDDLAPYFNPNNLELEVIDRQKFFQTGQLPEGFYTFSIEVLEYNRGTLLSNNNLPSSNPAAWLLLNDPPRWILPYQNELIRATYPQNMLFQWLPMHTSSPNAIASGVSYEFTMVEIWPEGRDPNDALRSQTPFFRDETDMPQLVMGPVEPSMTPGRKYAVQVRVKDQSGLDYFKNQGYSEVLQFKFGEECLFPTGITVPELFHGFAKIQWISNPGNTQYQLRYRQQGQTQWYTQSNVVLPYQPITGLEGNTIYEYQIAAECGNGIESEFSPLQTFTTPEQPANQFVCDDPATKTPVFTTTEPKEVLQNGEFLTVRDYKVRVTRVNSGGNGVFSGRGIVLVPYLHNTGLEAVFENVSVNKDNQVTAGKIVVVTEKTVILDQDSRKEIDNLNAYVNKAGGAGNFPRDTAKKWLEDVNKLIETVPNLPASAQADIYNGRDQLARGLSMIAAGNTEAGQAELDKGKQNIQKGLNKAGQLAGKAGGNIVSLDKQKPLINSSPNGIIIFKPSSQGQYGFDEKKRNELAGKYEQEVDHANNSTLYIPWKALESGKPEPLDVQITAANTSFKADSVKFKTSDEAFIAAQPSTAANTKQLTLIGGQDGDEKSVFAVYPDKDGGKNLSKINTVSFDKIVKNIVLVPLTGSKITIDADVLLQRINKIYQQALAEFSFEQELSFALPSGWDQNNDGKIDIGNSGLLSNYTKDMQNIMDGYKSSHPQFDDNKYYLFIGGDAVDGDAKGYMPRAKNFGFIFNSASNQLEKSIAHELGHGVFHLRHTFVETTVPEGTSDNLMDYSTGNYLNKYQWSFIHDPVFVLGILESDEDNALKTMYTLNLLAANLPGVVNTSAPALGITPEGKIVSSVKSKNPAEAVVPIICEGIKYVICGFSTYLEGQHTDSYKWSVDKKDYYNASGTKLDVTVNSNAGRVKVYINAKNNCNYYVQEIDWQDPSDANVVEAAVETKVDQGKWIGRMLMNADSSCFANFIKEIIARDASGQCNQMDNIEDGKKQLLAFTQSATVNVDKLTATINNVCKTAISAIGYDNIENLFKKLASLKTIKEEKEIAILRLMSSISTTDYAKFYALLENNSNALLRNLVKEMDDKAFYSWSGKDDYTNFIGGLVTMFRYNPDAYIDRFYDVGNEALLGQVFNLHGQAFKSDIEIGPLGTLIPLNQARFVGTYNKTTGKIKVIREERVLAGNAMQGSIPVWTPNGDEWPEVSPLTPVIITAKDDLPLVQTALGDPQLPGNMYIVPAIFLKFKGDKEFNDAAEKTGMISFDVITIFASGGTALATKVTWVRRIWAIAEVAGAAGNIGVNLGVVNPNSKLGKAVLLYNGAMALIGIKNLGKGVFHFAKNLPQNVKDLIKTNGRLRAILLSKYLDYKVATTELKNSDEWRALKTAQQEEVLTQEKLIGKLVEETVQYSEIKRAFMHAPTSGAIIADNAKQGTFLIGSFPTDLEMILTELNYPKLNKVDFAFPVPAGQKFNLLNISDTEYNYWVNNGGFFSKVNGPWVDAAVAQGAEIYLVSDAKQLYNSAGTLTGFGKEVHRFEWKHGYRFDPSTKMMVPPSKAGGLSTLTKQSEYTHN